MEISIGSDVGAAQSADLNQRQYVTPGEHTNLGRRWGAYDYMRRGNQLMRRFLLDMQVQANDSVLEVGCNKGHNLQLLRELGHTGIQLGLDIHPDIFGNPSDNSTYFVVGDAGELPFAPGSLDVVMAPFMLYHVPEPQLAINSMVKVLKHGGRLGITTSGTGNKPKHRIFERDLADYLGVEPPPRFNAAFTTDHLASLVADWSMATEPGELHVKSFVTEEDLMSFDAKTYPVYLTSLSSMRSTFSPAEPALDDALWNQALAAVVEPSIQAEIEVDGYFTDVVQRSYAVAQLYA